MHKKPFPTISGFHQKKLWILFLSSVICLLFSFPVPISADTLESSSYKVTFGNFNITSGEKSSASYTVTDTVGQIAPGEYDGNGYVVKSGFQYLYPFDAFSFRISKLAIHLGNLSYGSFNSDSHTLTVDAAGTGGYAVRAHETHPLRLQSGTSTIPDTTCNSGSCSQASAGIWTDPTKPGFGFNLSGDDVASDFLSNNHFRQFADLSSNETAQTIMMRNSDAVNRNATVMYKVAPKADQAAGLYETQVVYVAVPTY